jgi:membrane-associated phospholipid phosphatase
MIAPERRPFLAWPGWPHLRLACLQMILVSAWFGLVFAGSDWFTAQRAARVRVHLDAELGIPLIPAFTVVYMSIYLLFIAAPLVLRTRREITTLAATQALIILVAGIGFLLLPAKLAFAPATAVDLGAWKPLFQLADRLNLDYNLMPSLHVALSIACVELFAVHASASGKILLRAWGLLIAASTLFTHQHHLVDAITGYVLAVVTVMLVRQARIGPALSDGKRYSLGSQPECPS